MDTTRKLISEVMTRTVCEVTTDLSVLQALALMQRKSVSSVLVVEDKLTLGIVTERDVVRALHRSGNLKGLSCTDLMQAPVISVMATASCLEVYHLMVGRGIRHMAVTDNAGQLVGIASEGDILRDFGIEYYMSFKDVGGVMTSDVCLLPESARVAEAVARMDEDGHKCVFAADDAGRPVGVLTERDIVSLCHRHDHPESLQLGQVMSKPVRTAKIGDLLHEAVKSMEKAGIRRLAVTDDDGRMCGLLSHHEIVRGLEGNYVGYLKEMVQRQEKALRTREEASSGKALLENILRSIACTALIAADRECRIVYCNPASTTVLKLPHAAAVGQDMRDVLAGLGWPAWNPVQTEAALMPGKVHTRQLAWMTGGDHCCAELQISLLIDARNQPQGYLLLARDVPVRSGARGE